MGAGGRALALLLLGGAWAACSSEPHPEAINLLQAHFAAHVDRVLAPAGGLRLRPSADGRGFVAAPPSGAAAIQAAETALAGRGRLLAVFPSRGGEPVRLSLADGFALEVVEEGLHAAARLERGAVVYERGSGESSFWRVTASGPEEWLLVRPAAAGTVAAWQVNGGALVQRGTAVDIVDGAGAARVTVTAPAAYAASGTPVAARLRARAARLELVVDEAPVGELLLVDPLWQVTGGLANARYNHTATLLPSGKVLVAGGAVYSFGAESPIASAELYDPATGAFTPTGSLAVARSAHTATLLPTGQVLIAGGLGPYPRAPVAQAELYDPATGQFTNGGTMQTARLGHTATLLQTGKVLLVGGGGFYASAWHYFGSAELYTPATKSFATSAGTLAPARGNFTATLLSNGKVLVAGGESWSGASNYYADAAIYDPSVDTFTATGLLKTARSSHAATLLPSGKVLVAGGQNSSGHLASAELFDPAGGTFTVTGPLATSRVWFSATLAPTGKVVVAGGYHYDPTNGSILPTGAEQYDWSTGAFTAAGTIATGRDAHSATLLASGRVLIVGGTTGGNNGNLASAELYDPTVPTITATTAPLLTARYRHTGTLLPSGKVLLAGGITGSSTGVASMELYDPATGTTTTTANLSTGRGLHTATLLPSGKVLVAGGYNGNGLAAVDLYDPAAGTATAIGPLATPRYYHTATLLGNGKVLLAGGEWYGDVGPVELYDPSAGTFSSPGSLAAFHSRHTATLLPSGKVLVAGGYAYGSINTAELYDPVTNTSALTGSLGLARDSHTATLLTTGKVLITGGVNNGTGTYQTQAELYDPATGTFSYTGTLATGRAWHRATLLPSGKVLVSGGQNGNTYLTSMELYDPATGTFAVVGNLGTGRSELSATMLQSGAVLLAGGASAFWTASAAAEVFDEGRGAQITWTPTLAALPGATAGTALPLTGTLLTGLGEWSSGTTMSSPTNYPLLLLRRVDSEAQTLVPTSAWSATGASAAVPINVIPGPVIGWAITNGVLSNGRPTVVASAAWATGSQCTLDYVCATGACSDGYCCDQPCRGQCMGCSSAKTGFPSGQCANYGQNTDPEGDCPSGFTCDGAGHCRTSCTADLQCKSGYYCTSASAGACALLKAFGVACGGDSVDGTGSHQCASGNCVDGVCCNTACNGTCQACVASKNGGATGLCGVIPANTDPDGECGSGLTCNGAGACWTSCASDAQCKPSFFCEAGGHCTGQSGLGAACPDSRCQLPPCRQCQSQYCVDGVCCDQPCSGGCLACSAALGASSDGTCTLLQAGSAGASPSCTPYVCDGVASTCPTACGGDGDCASGFYCAYTGTCQSRRGNGATCDLTADCLVSGCRVCQSGSCADGFCCDHPCTGGCDACALAMGASANGVCTILPPGRAGSSPSCTPYVCDGASASCPGTCSGDSGCAAGYYCDAGGLCRARKATGSTCNLTADCKVAGCGECASGTCADGFCCDQPCAGGCDVCAQSLGAAANGACTVLGLGSVGASPSCGGFLCDGSSGDCPTKCSGDGSCRAGYYCAADSTCQQRKADGATCNLTADCRVPGCRECTSGTCADGYCCDQPCAGGCDVCAQAMGASANGVCTVLGAGGSGSNPACTPYACDGHAACPTGCLADDGCVAGYYCAADGTCQAQRGTGAGCDLTADCSAPGCRECASGHCVDGFCCSAACDQGCDVCAAAAGATANGWCTVLPVGVPGTSCGAYLCGGAAACPSSCTDDSDCAAGFFCDSDGHCQGQRAAGAVCNVAADCHSAGCRECLSGNCVDGVCCNSACGAPCYACNVAGHVGACWPSPVGGHDDDTCGTAADPSCGLACDGAGHCAYAVTAVVCGTTSQTCTGGLVVLPEHCNGAGSCVTDARSCGGYACAPNGVDCLTSCTRQSDCTSGSYCDNGVCYGDKALGASCTLGTECSSGSCADGVCCDATCGGACRSCALQGSVGHCTFAPLGLDPRSDCGGVPPCGGTCDGTGACAFPGPAVSCGVATCNGETFAPSPACDGAGTCAAAATVDCTPYRCEPGTARCLSTCNQDADCQTGRYCSGHTCVPAQGGGQPCTSPHECASGNCVDGVCCDSTCDGPCTYCRFPGSEGTCLPVPDLQDPRRECQAATGGVLACAGSCQAGQCAFPDVGTRCGRCAVCDGTGRCTDTPADDDACGVIQCGDLGTACRSYHDLTASRCASLGACKAPNDPATCTDWTDLNCDDAGTPRLDGGAAQGDGGTPGQDGGSASSKSGGCHLAPSGAPVGMGLLAVLLPVLVARRRRRG